jgi:long-chain acyl-CoA synthetase
MLSWELDAQPAGAPSTGMAPPQPVGQAAALLGIPLFHVTASHAVFLMSYRLQRKLVSMYKWDPEAAAVLVERERISVFIGPAAVTGDLVRVATTTKRDLSSLLAIGGGGAPRAPEQVRQIDASFERAAASHRLGHDRDQRHRHRHRRRRLPDPAREFRPVLGSGRTAGRR